MAQPDTYNDGELAVRLQKEYAAVNKELNRCNLRWNKLLTNWKKSCDPFMIPNPCLFLAADLHKTFHSYSDFRDKIKKNLKIKKN